MPLRRAPMNRASPKRDFFNTISPNRTFFRRQKPFAIAQGDGADEGRRVIAASPERSENSVFTLSRETESGSSGVSGGSRTAIEYFAYGGAGRPGRLYSPGSVDVLCRIPL